jgi:pre-rRNA-processing protein TSR1
MVVSLLCGPQESLPPEYARIFAFDNFTRTQKLVLAKTAELDEGSSKDCARIGSYVMLHVKNVPTDVASKLCDPSRRSPVVVSGLLQHESKISVLHFRYFLSTDKAMWSYFL